MTLPVDEAFRAFTERLYDQNKFAIKLGLDNISKALEILGRPDRSHRAIVVGGTNGKGETGAFLSNILQSSGLTVGFFSSPHLVSFNERFRVDGRALPIGQVTEVGRRMLAMFGDNSNSESDVPSLTFFEIATAMAAVLFDESEVDVAIYEVGLGGRLDAVNAIDRDLVVITNIGYDHQQYLGETLDEIVHEKASLTVEFPTVIGPQSYEWNSPFRRADWIDVASDFADPNCATAVAAANLFLGDSMVSTAVEHGIAATRWPGRFDFRTLNTGRVLFDAAHNPDGLRFLAERIRKTGFRPNAIYWGMMRDKDVESCVRILREFDVPITGVAIRSDRALNECEFRALGVREIKTTDEVVLEDGALVCGSVFLLGEFYERFSLSTDIRVASTR